MRIIDKKKFAIILLKVDNKNLVIHITILLILIMMLIHSNSMTLIALLINTKIFTKYFYLFHVFFLDLIAELSKHIRINNYYTNIFDNK